MGSPPHPEAMSGERPSIEGNQAIPTALDREGKSIGQALEAVGVSCIGCLLVEEVAIGITPYPEVIEAH